ncbi:MAG: hypothetical protein P1P84_25855, partial [Deferrisomatales bacterium]|nr:hypothetical protein [Deferrisomatales bacterium]
RGIAVAILVCVAALPWLHTRYQAGRHLAVARHLESVQRLPEAVREYASAIRYHIPASGVTRQATTQLLGIGRTAAANEQPGLALSAYQAVAAALEAISRPRPVQPAAKAEADAALEVLLGSPVPRPVFTTRWLWITPTLLVLWSVLLSTRLTGICRKRWLMPSTAVVYILWLGSLRWI